MSVGDALAVNSAVGADHLALAVRKDAPKEPSDPMYLGHGGDQNLVAQTPIAIEPAWVVSEKGLDAIGVVHFPCNRRDPPSGRVTRLGIDL